MDLMVEVNTRPGIKFLKEAPHICGCHQIAFEFIVECETRNMFITKFQWNASALAELPQEKERNEKRKKVTKER